MLKQAANLKASGVQLIALLALDDKGAPGFDQQLANRLAGFSVPCFACTPGSLPQPDGGDH